jgi:Ca2+-binding EF-hand superfamily protein
MDSNGNGKLEQSEIPEYRRSFVSMIVTRLGGDPNKTIDLADLARKASASSSSSNSSRSSTPASGAASTVDPLVPYFGEKETAQTPILAFGQREPQAKTTVAAASNSATSSVSQSDQILRSAREIMNKYDKNKNGTLDKDKGEWISSLPFNADAADKNRDGRVSMTELIDILGGKANATTGSAAVSTKQSSAYDRLPPGMPDWFFERDKDQNGQLTMMEYANGQPWTEDIAKEFLFLDKNNDGTATVAEIFETLIQVDEEKRLKEEQAKRDIERRKGTGSTATAVTPPPPQPADQQPVPPPPPGTPPVAVTPAAEGTPPAVPPQPGSEPTPNWRPSASGAVPTTPPSTAPYSSGSSGSSDSDRRRSYQRSSSSRSRGR